jgi:APA family basic amino acid/polyamine antiporter
VPAGAVIFSATLSIAALFFFSTFSRIVTFFVVPLQVVNILLVASVFRLRARVTAGSSPYLTPGYPWVPAVFILVLSLFLLSALVYNPWDTLAGVAMTATGIPVYRGIARGARGRPP